MKISKFWKNQSGAAAVELAILAPVLILLAVGTFEFGLLLYNKQVITNAAREGARAGIVRGDKFSTNDKLKDIVKDYCDKHRLIDYGGTLTNEDILLELELSGVESSDSDRLSAGFGDDFSVKITYDHELFVPSLFKLDQTITLRSLALMRMEQIP